ncbi:MAG: hypothetical protein EOO85_31750 [Pedobacter sp.]|nr:MAG: hypothetical protein EOO85_31750 [Pedobacter sp.]
MKTVKSTLALFIVSALLLTVGCKKKTTYPEGQDPEQNLANSVSANDLENYYLVGETNGAKKIFVIYFSKEGATVKANMHLTGALRVADAVVTNAKFSFDFDANTNRLYNFEFEKDASGLVSLKNYTLTDKASPLVLKQDGDRATVKVVEYVLLLVNVPIRLLAGHRVGIRFQFGLYIVLIPAINVSYVERKMVRGC